MKANRFLLPWVLCLLLVIQALPAKAFGLDNIRINARFLTDRMAFELNLNPSQYDAIYEVNYDFLSGVDDYLYDMGYADRRAVEAYTRYLEARNEDLRWVLSQREYQRFRSMDHFYRPIYASGNRCALRIYLIYPNWEHFYYDRPAHYYTYKGGHSRVYFERDGYYKHHFKKMPQKRYKEMEKAYRYADKSYRKAEKEWSKAEKSREKAWRHRAEEKGYGGWRR